MEPQHPQSPPHSPRNDSDSIARVPRSWTLPASILLGSMIAGVFEPLILIVGVGALVWLGMIHRSSCARIDALAIEGARLDTQIDEGVNLSSRLASILDSADVPIVATDSSGTIVLANIAAKSILGSGRPLLFEYFDTLITQRPVRELEQLARQGESGHARLRLPVRADMREFDVAADPIQGTGGAVCTFTDITELSHSATLKADFAANASHELRTPIASILGAIQTIEGPAKNDPVMTTRLIGMISTNATRLDSMVKDLLDLSKLESTAVPTVLSRVNLSQVIERCSNPLAQVCERRKLTIVPRIDEQVGTILTDASLIELILRNLIENATKFAREGTAITIHAEPISMGVSPDTPIPAGLDGSMGVRIGVRDEGIGIPLAHQVRIFERFYQVDEARDGSSARRGTGLGLAIVKHAARTLGGKVRLNSIHQQGTTMIVELPRCVIDQETPVEPA